jgi:hypothetical protein
MATAGAASAGEFKYPHYFEWPPFFTFVRSFGFWQEECPDQFVCDAGYNPQW